MSEEDIMKPETFVPPAVLAEADQWEMAVRDHCEETLELLKELIREDGYQSLTSWSFLMAANVDSERLAINLAYFMLRAANAEIEAERNATGA